MTSRPNLPVITTVATAYRLLWTHRRLHVFAIWPPVLFLVAADFLFHKTVGDAHNLAQAWKAFIEAAWYWPAAIVLLWLAGLKFVLSFSISWRRHIMLGEAFNPFYFKRPFWAYLGYLGLVYAGLTGVLASAYGVARHFFRQQMTVCTFIYSLHLHAPFCTPIFEIAAAVVAIILFAWGFCVILRVPVFNAIALGDRTGRKPLRRAMLRQFGFYVVAWVAAMLPIFALTALVSLANRILGLDVSATPVALAESAFRQACLFVHVSLGASIGMATYAWIAQSHAPDQLSRPTTPP